MAAVNDAMTTITLDGTASTANTGDTTVNSYAWTQVAAAADDAAVVTSGDDDHIGAITPAAATAAHAAGRTATATVPARFPAGNRDLFFRLVVTDDDGTATATAMVAVTAVDDDPTITQPTTTACYIAAGAGADDCILFTHMSRVSPSVPAMDGVAAMPVRVRLTATGARTADADADSVPAAMYTWTQVENAAGDALTTTANRVALRGGRGYMTGRHRDFHRTRVCGRRWYARGLGLGGRQCAHFCYAAGVVFPRHRFRYHHRHGDDGV